MMNQHIFYPNQILARILLTIWLPITCSPEATVAAPPSQVAAASTNPVDAASSSSDLQEARQQAPGITPAQELLAAAAQGKRVKVQSILAKGEVDINAVDAQGKSALHQAMIAGHTKIAVLLIKYGADLALEDNEHQTPINYAGADRGYFSAIAALVQLFSTLDGLIESSSIQNQDEIDHKLDEVCIWLTKLEVKETQDKKQYKYFKHRYHIQNARYLEALGETREAAMHKELAENYQDQEPSPRYLDPAEQQELEAAIAAGAKGAGVTDEAAAHMKKHLDEIIDPGILSEDACNQIKYVIAVAKQGIHNFASYRKASTARAQFKDLRSNFLQQCDNSSQVSDNVIRQKIEQGKKSWVTLDTQVTGAIDGNRIAFIKSTVALSAHIQYIFFANLLPIAEEINRRYTELACQFDPEKAAWLPEAYHSDAHALMYLITFCRDELLQDTISAARCQKRGDIAWRAYMNYWYVQQKQWDQLPKLIRTRLTQLSPDQIEASRIATAKDAYKYYRSSIRKVANENRKSQVQLRSSLALCLDALGAPLAAQLCASAAVKLTEGHANESQITPEDQAAAQEILQQIKISNPTSHGSRSAPSKPLDEEDEMLAYLEGLAGNIIFKSTQGLVRYQSSEKEIAQAQNQAWRYDVAGLASWLGGGGMNIAMGVFFDTVLPAVIAPPLVPVIVLALLGPIVLGLGGCIHCASQSERLCRSVAVRQALNSLIVKAVQCYDQGDMQGFLNELSAKYAGKQLFSLEDVKAGIDLNNIIQSLMQHGIRPDGAAGVLNLLGGALQEEVSIPGCTQELLAQRAEESFQGTFNERLAQSANSLDERVSEIRKEIMANVRQRYEHELADFWLLKEKEDQKKKGKERKISLAKEHLEDAQEMPFSVRLATVRNIARLNLARMCIMRYLGSRKNEDIEYVKMLASQIQDSLERYGSFYTPIARQLAAIKEIVFIVSGQEIDPAPNVTTAAAPDLQSPQEARSDATLEQLKERLEQAKSDEDRVKIHNQRAAKHLQEAQEKSKISHLKSLDSWQEAQKDYDSALGLIKDDTTASLGNARCLIGLAQYGQALQFLKEHPSINDTPDFWIMASIAYRKQCDYTKAKEYILEALQLDPQNKEAVREKAVIDKLIAKTEGKKRAAYTKPQLQYEESYLEARREGKKQHYTILAIDGGGVRGVVPALWLNKLEERTRRPIAHLFNMLAGTSTGGIITTALSVPSEQTPSTPRYAASEIVELYRQKSPKIFPPEKRKDTNLLSSKYTDAGRSAVFTEYFKQYRLKDALTELVIPAVRSENTTTTYVFTRNKAEKNDADNVTLYDAVMATTAAPTFFPAYQIDGKGIFFDGSIQAGNPAQQAYDEACCVTSKENILMLSMGAGTCISDPLQPDLHCGKLFWAGNYPRVSLALQEGGTDRSMRISLGEDRYQRWQVWLENPIGLDDCQQIDTLLELGEQYIEELYASQDNTMNKLLERLEDHAPLAAQGPSQAVNQKMV